MAVTNKPFSQACENNQRPIAAVLARHLGDAREVLEIGSGSGQHAVHFGKCFPHLHWQTSDLAEHHDGIRRWIDESGLVNVGAPLTLDVHRQPWPATDAQAVFSANTAHILAWPGVVAMFAGVGALLPRAGRFLLYGPFNYGGRFTSDSNARFDAWLRQRDPASGVRDFEAVDELARAAGLALIEDNAMPANNRLLVWQYP